MLKIARYSLLLLITYAQSTIHGQELRPDSSRKHEIYDFNVKQLDDFTDRFNYKSDYKGNAIDTEAVDVLSRQNILASLFNHVDPRIDRGGEHYSPEYESLIMGFIDMVCRDSIYLDKNSEAIFASAEASGKYKKSTVSFNIILRQEKVGKQMLKWVIRDIEAEFLQFLLTDTMNLRFLPPSSGELDFIELRRALKEVNYLNYYAHKDYTYNQLSVFFYLLNSGELEIESIREVKYVLYNIPGWCMILKDFNRRTVNSGWLIDDLYKTSFPY